MHSVGRFCAYKLEFDETLAPPLHRLHAGHPRDPRLRVFRSVGGDEKVWGYGWIRIVADAIHCERDEDRRIQVYELSPQTSNLLLSLADGTKNQFAV
jgi:hypothetical protein